MRDKIYAYLKLQKGGATSSALVEHVLKIRGASPNVSERLIRTVIAGDRRFAVDEHHRWKIIEWGGTPLSETEFVFLSLLTVDTVGATRTIVEISAQKLKNDEIIDRLHIFINPGVVAVSATHLPTDLAQEIRRGVFGEKAVRSLSDFLGEAVLVGYDIQSSINQLNRIPDKSTEAIENPSLCLKYLTKKLIPDLHLKSMDDIATFFKLPVMDTRRTEGEVCTVAEIFSSYRELLKGQGIGTLEEVLEFQYPVIEYVDFGKYAFDKGFLWAIPQKPGIYKMKNKDGELIYVGKAKNLKLRVSSYFWNTADRLQKITDLLNTVYTLEYEVVGSELAAMLMEFRLIKQCCPRFNQQIEIHERAARYGNLKNFIILLPALTEGNFELFFVKEGLPLQRYELFKDAVNFFGVERILAKIDTQNYELLSDVEMGEVDIVLSWVETNKDYVNYINTDTVGSKEACLKLLKDYTGDEETSQKKLFRSL